MPADTRMPTPFPSYDPSSQRRRDRARAFFSKPVGWKHVGMFIIACLAALGWTINTPGKRLDALDARVLRTEKRIDTLAEQQRFTNYMLCVNARRTDPASVPPDCAPVIEARTHK